MDHFNPTASTSRSGHSSNQPAVAVGARLAGESNSIEFTHEIISVGRPEELCIQRRSENMRTCPYNAVHRVLESCLSNHISQCRQDFLMCQSEEGKEVIMLPCRYNPNHQVPVQELKQHQEGCRSNVDLLQEGDNADGDQAALLSRKDVDAGGDPTQGNDDHFHNAFSTGEDELRKVQIQSTIDMVSVDSLLQELVKEADFVPPDADSPVVEQCYAQCTKRNRRIRRPPPQANSDETNGPESQHQWEMSSSESTDNSLDWEDVWPTRWDHPSSLDPSWWYVWYRDPRADYDY